MINRENKKVRINSDCRQKITIGYKGSDGLPKKTDYFVLAHPDTGQEYYPELISVYGNTPTEIFVSFPTDDMRDFYNDNYNLWGKNNAKKRTCDGINCIHITEETIMGVKYGQGEESECVCSLYNLPESNVKELKNIACKCDAYLQAYILHPKTMKYVSPLPYVFATHSINSADNLFSELSRYNKFIGYPFKLVIKKIKKGNNQNYCLMNLYPVIDTDKLINYNLRGSAMLIENINDDNKLMLPEHPEHIDNDNKEVNNEVTELDSLSSELTPDERKRFKKKYKDLIGKLNYRAKEYYESVYAPVVDTLTDRKYATKIINDIEEYIKING